MRRLFLGLALILALYGCGSVDEKTEPEEKQVEMTAADILENLEQITYRYVEGNERENGSFEQRSSLQAAIKRADTVYEEIRERYEEIPVAEEFATIRSHVKLGSEEGLEEKYILMEIHLDLIKELVQEISEEYLDGELPKSMK